MAKPRVFLSSTCYDLKYIRNDLQRFIKDLGYEPVLNERGHIAYGRSESLEQYCYQEISTCDILVHIVGGKFGSPSKTEPYSISQMELKTAHELHKQIYVFVERQVNVEYHTYLKNEENQSFIPQYVDDVKIYEFLKEIYNLTTNNIIAGFDSVNDITGYLKEQWAGRFQRFLQEESRREDYKISTNLKSTAETLAKLIEYTTKERDETIKTILVNSHPIFSQLSQATDIPIRVFFSNFMELDTLLTTFEFENQTGSDYDEFVYSRDLSGTKTTLRIPKDIFDESMSLKPVESDEWERNFISVETEESDLYVSPDDVPF